ncbi:type I toxin-antitoxin system Hok family toxin [Serratia fonticola]|uniref:type I toxin-antitoxin system Hok family toxin n=1 Tax=Serratia fonticola TaxID=47917 RepID=UPI0021BB45C9|nr:type I toxin-antitoxin system Hok family toxin [Serratia fonticola]
MLNKGNIVKLVVICTTVILLVWLTRSKLCELRILSGNTEVAAILAYESER